MRVRSAALAAAALLALAAGPAFAQAQVPDAVRACALPAKVVWHHDPVLSLTGAVSYGSDRAAEDFVLAIMQGAAAWRGTADPETASRTIAELAAWAEAGALGSIVEVGADLSNTNSIYSLRRALIPLLMAWRDLAPAATRPDRQAIERWLDHLSDLADTDTGSRKSRGRSDAVSNRNNHSYMRATIDALRAGPAHDVGRAAKAAAIVQRAVAEMRPDGSLPLETARGDRALWYQRHALASLVFIAELLRPFGYDLYAPRPDGRSLHDAVEFLAAASETPSLVSEYAAANRNPKPGTSPDEQDLGFLQPRGHGRHYMAWFEIYQARFPDRETTRRLARLVRPSLEEARPMIDELAGGNTTCRIATGARVAVSR